MARIPDVEIERLKKEVPIERLVMGFGVELKRHGAEWIGTCPFHEDKTPSLVMSPKTNLWHCLGACNAGGSTIDWVMRTKGVSFRHAVELLRADHSSLAAGEARVVKKGTTAKLDAPVKAEADDQEALRQVMAYYHETLKESPEALRYLESRGLTHPEMLERFQIGFANRTLGYRLPDKNRKEGAELRGRLQKLGIIRESGHEHFMGSIVFPVVSLEGSVTEMYGRKITAGLRAGTPLHTYLPGPHRGRVERRGVAGVKGNHPVRVDHRRADVLVRGVPQRDGSVRRERLHGRSQGGVCQAWRASNVWIAYDRDEAGDAAAGRLKEELALMGIGSHRVLFPHGMDANEYALHVKPAAQSLAVLLNGAEWLTRSEQACARHSFSRRSPSDHQRRRDHARARRPPLPRPRTGEKSLARTDEGERAGVAAGRLPSRHVRLQRRPPARRVHQARRRGTARQGRYHPQRHRLFVPATRRTS